VSPRTAAELALLDLQLGSDLALAFAGTGGWWEDADLVPGREAGRVAVPVDLATTTGVPAAVQFLVDRLKTQQGELIALGHPEYGSRHHELIGQPNVQRTQNLIKVYVLEALRHEPRIEKVLSAKVYATSSPPRDTVQIDLTVLLIGQPNPLNFVVPFSLEVGG
jgi:phage baseplate assembly protein W